MADIYGPFPRDIIQYLVLTQPKIYNQLLRLNKYYYRTLYELLPTIAQQAVSPSELVYNVNQSQFKYELNLFYSQPKYQDTIQINVYPTMVGPLFLRLTLRDEDEVHMEEFRRVFSCTNLQPLYDRLKKQGYLWQDLKSLHLIYSARESCIQKDKDYVSRQIWREVKKRLAVIKAATDLNLSHYKPLFDDLYSLASPEQKESAKQEYLKHYRENPDLLECLVASLPALNPIYTN